MNLVFLLSPANAGGKRAQILMNEAAEFELAVKLREQGASIGEIFSFMSGLYFRGKLAYAQAFASPPPGVSGVLVITSGYGLLPCETIMTIPQLQAAGAIPIDADDPRYREPLDRDALQLAASVTEDCRIVLLGSVATTKYLGPLFDIFGDRLLFPEEFAGMGDMKRGSLMLRCASEGRLLTHVPVGSATRHRPDAQTVSQKKP